MFQNMNYINIIESLENDKTIELIGKINITSLTKMTGDDLLYVFPLIERIVIEIYKLIPGAIVEVNTQGTMKSLPQIIKDNECNNIFADNLEIKNLLFKYYDKDDSLRNILFHPKEDEIIIQYNIVEINYIVASLLRILNEKISLFDINNLKKIEKI